MNRKVIPFIGDSNFTKELKELIHTLSQSNASVLLVGEGGTGKRLFAKHLHFDASDDFGYFYEINCRSFNSKQVHIAFDTVSKLVAFNQRITLYVSFVNELTADLQQAFLDFIDKTFKKGLNLKLVCSVEEPLENNVNNGSFSADLYYRLNAIVLNMLPLRQRKEDIIPVAEYYLDSFKTKSGLKFEGFNDDAREKMMNRFWVGNIDELINSVQRAFIVGKPPYITPADLGILQQSVLPVGFTDVNSASGVEQEPMDKSLKTAVDAFKKEYVTKILEENGWNQTKTAKILGIQRTYVIRLMNELQIRKK